MGKSIVHVIEQRNLVCLILCPVADCTGLFAHWKQARRAANDASSPQFLQNQLSY